MTCNAEMGPSEVRDFCKTDASGERLLKAAMQQLHLSARAYHRVLKLARTIADLAECEDIAANHQRQRLIRHLRRSRHHTGSAARRSRRSTVAGRCRRYAPSTRRLRELIQLAPGGGWATASAVAHRPPLVRPPSNARQDSS